MFRGRSRSLRATSLGFVAALLGSSGCQPSGKSTASPASPEATDPDTGFENPGGMWLPTQMGQHAETLKSLGLAYPAEDLTDLSKPPLAGVVSLGGCSGSFVSPQGLVITNHHCVIGALQHNSTKDSNLLEDGYLASSPADELWAGPNARIFVHTRATDVTDEVLGGATPSDAAASTTEIESRIAALVRTCEEAEAGKSCRVQSYFEGNEYWLLEYLQIQDVRLVYAPHAGIGVFGGEVDNWRWPRHTGDYAFLRAYVGPDGKPAPHHADNVPYRPAHHLEVSTDGLRPGDVVMVAGYPGRTYRFRTAAEVEETLRFTYPELVERHTAYIDLLEQLGAADADRAIKISSRLKRLHNGRTKVQGTMEGLTGHGLVAQKKALEADLEAWIAADPERQKAYGGVIEEIAAIARTRAQTAAHDAAVREIRTASALLGAALTLAEPLPEASKGAGAAKADEAVRRRVQRELAEFDPVVDRASLGLALRRISRLDPEQRPDVVLRALLGKDAELPATPEAIDAALDRLYAKTSLDDPKKALALVGSKRLAASKDPFVKAALEIRTVVDAVSARERDAEATLATLRPRYVEALRAFLGTPMAPDANSTLRITFGTVRGYRLGPDAPFHEPFTTVPQMVDKHTGQAPFAAPGRILEAAARASESKWVDPQLQTVPLDFLADLDITGGNSGSATLDARGRLVGLAFDGTYESVASDWVFMPEITRSIHVDIRYVLWIMDEVDRAHHLMREMGIEPTTAAPEAKATAARRMSGSELVTRAGP